MKLSKTNVDQLAWAITILWYAFTFYSFLKITTSIQSTVGNMIIGLIWGGIISSIKYFKALMATIIDRINFYFYRRSKEYFIDNL